jgi:hypothetical protein
MSLSRFTIRVELHRAAWDEYVQLAANLAACNIKDILPLTDGSQWKMQPGMYHCWSDLSPEGVHGIVETCVAPIGRQSAILVSKSAGIFVSGESTP